MRERHGDGAQRVVGGGQRQRHLGGGRVKRLGLQQHLNIGQHPLNEVILHGLRAAQIWPGLNDTSAWPSYYANASDIRFHDGTGPLLRLGARFRFTTFGFLVEAEVTEYVPPADGQAARVAWHGWVEGDSAQRLDVHHAWLIEDLDGHRVRILTQETQTGQPARELAATRPNPMLNAHQAWLDGLVQHALATV